MSKAKCDEWLYELIGSTDNIITIIDKLFILLNKIQNEGRSFDETKHILNICISLSTRSTEYIFNWLNENQNESKYVLFLGIFYYYYTLNLDKNTSNKGFKCLIKTASYHPIAQLYLGIIHRDFHSGNILCKNEYDIVINDLGISKLSTESLNNDNKYYGIIPYIAPEIFQGQKYKKYSEASDIYSFSMIMWELMVGRRPFWDRDYNTSLIIDICDNIRPPIVTNAPEGYIKLMQECWQSDPKLRPTAEVIFSIIDKIILNEEKSESIYDSNYSGNVNDINTKKFKFNESYNNESDKNKYISNALEFDISESLY
ncbi:11577_t:CDS:2 [Funneliformis geosporum]|uniref:11577_t:CDS:1 n=1 Tax=Funneliformis geosporum TaxID=1117311 RepID=A0A9W4SGP4_9GLOM|nr:11577_t:CDS:2 [Funneliformis geosporum]